MGALFQREMAFWGLVLTIFSSRPFSANSAAFRPVCRATGPITLLTRDPETGAVVRITNDETRRLEHRSTSPEEEVVLSAAGLRGGAFELDDFTPVPSVRAVPVHSRDLQDGDETFLMQECTCRFPEPVYCPLNVNFCGVYRGQAYEDFPLGCLSQYSRSDEFAQTVLLVIVVWLSVLLACVVCSVPGRNFLSCFVATLFPCWNKYHADRLLGQNPPDRAHYLIRRNLYNRHLALQRQLLSVAPDLVETATENAAATTLLAGQQREPENKPVPTSLVLKTRIYKSERSTVKEDNVLLHHIEDEDDLETNCIICFQALLNGDRVGALSCSHVMHAECLKGWLKRRNVCPLCQCSDAAAPQFDEVQPVEESTGGATDDEPRAILAEIPASTLET